DAAAPPANALVLLLAALLAGNGVVAMADARRRPLLALLVDALRHAGVPSESLLMAPEDLDVVATLARSEITFVAADANEATTRAIYRLLGGAQGPDDS